MMKIIIILLLLLGSYIVTNIKAKDNDDDDDNVKFLKEYMKLKSYKPDTIEIEDPTYCVEWISQSYNCNPYQCNCQVCHNCGCHTILPWHHCDYDSCGHCWCSPTCKCCYDANCRISCNCGTCYHRCSRLVCNEEITYNISSITPTVGRSEGGTLVVLRTDASFYNTHQILCKFGSNIVNGSYVSDAEIHCISPIVSTITPHSRLHLELEVSLDNGTTWTNDGHIFTYYYCGGNNASDECNGNGVCVEDATCLCNTGYWAADCEEECPGGHETPCSNHTSRQSCNTDGTCSPCNYGWYGPACNTPCPGLNTTEGICSGNGQCINGQCHCDTSHVGNACQFEGKCDEDTPPNCRCDFAGHYGHLCEACPGGSDTPCNLHGICDSYSGLCACSAGYYGESCADTCPGPVGLACNNRSNNAIPNSCNTNGTCECSSLYYGVACESTCPTTVLNQPCSGHGECDSDGNCECSSKEWTGNACQFECKGQISPGVVCNGRGECEQAFNGSCTCTNGSYGEACEFMCGHSNASTTFCDGKGTCTTDGHCSCMSGYYGEFCENECVGGSDHPCFDHGICSSKTGACICHPGYYSADCSLECGGGHGNNTCSGHGVCTTSGECECDTGYNGTVCENRYCVGECFDGGTCNNMTKTCDCFDGFEGEYCQILNPSYTSILHGYIQFTSTNDMIVMEGSTLKLELTRANGTHGPISILLNVSSLSSDNHRQFNIPDRIVSWDDAVGGVKYKFIDIIEDGIITADEQFEISITDPQGGPIVSNETVRLTITENTGAFENMFITVRMNSDYDATVGTAEKRYIFENAFRIDLATILNQQAGIPTSRIYISHVDEIPNESYHFLTTFRLSPGPGPSVIELTQEFMQLMRDRSSPLFKGSVTQYLDIEYAPYVVGHYISNDTSHKHPNYGLIFGLTIPLVCLLISIGLCYWKRKPLSEWLLFRLGQFRFRSLIEEHTNEAAAEELRADHEMRESDYIPDQFDGMNDLLDQDNIRELDHERPRGYDVVIDDD